MLSSCKKIIPSLCSDKFLRISTLINYIIDYLFLFRYPDRSFRPPNPSGKMQESTGNGWNMEAVFQPAIFRISSGRFLSTSCAFRQYQGVGCQHVPPWKIPFLSSSPGIENRKDDFFCILS